MLDQPDGRDLLAIARQTLLQSIVPALPGALRYDALMIANAMAIAAREIELAARAEIRERAALAPLLGAVAQDLDLSALRSALCELIREGVFDAVRSDELRAALRDSVEARLAISNPKLLAAAG